MNVSIKIRSKLSPSNDWNRRWSKEPGTIVQEIQKGFTIKDRLLRPALVGVAKKWKKEEKNEENKENSGDK